MKKFFASPWGFLLLLAASAAHGVLLRSKRQSRYDPPAATAEDYKLCGGTMNRAWKSFKESPCSHEAHEALVAMRNAADSCNKLRYAKDYQASYKELLEKTDLYCGTQDAQCGPPGVSNKEACNHHGHCKRQENFPFDPKCVCEKEWTGKACEEKVCIPKCENGGTCSDGVCSCPAGWRGDRCGEPICKEACTNGGRCVAPDKCGCAKGWNGTTCSEPVCKGGCKNGGKCVGPDKCECLHQRSVSVASPDGSDDLETVQEGFSGADCGLGPEFFFGDECKECVKGGDSWCLKDGVCSTDDSPSKEECPLSATGSSLEGFTPLIVKGHKSPCSVHYRECVEVASALVHMLNSDATLWRKQDARLRASCSEAASEAVLAAQKERARCGGINVLAIKGRIGTLKVVESYDSIVARAEKAHEACKK